MLILRMFTTSTPGLHNEYGTSSIKLWDLYRFYRHPQKRHDYVSCDHLSIVNGKYFKFSQLCNNSYSQH